MLTIYRRHRKSCKHRAKGRKHRHCQCPIWVDGFLSGQEIRKSLKVRDWQSAQEIIREWEIESRRPEKSARKSLADCWTEFLVDIEARKLHDSTIRQYKLLQRQMREHAEKNGLSLIDEFDLSTLGMFRSGWKDGPRSSAKKLERMRAFFRFAQRRNWISNNPAVELKAPRVTLRPTLPFNNEEMRRILEATEQYKEEMPSHGLENARRIRGLVLLLRYSGMRIGDAVNFNIEMLKGNRVFLYTQKTGVAVNTVLPEFVVSALAEMPRVTNKFFFWSGSGKLESSVRSWHTRLRRLFNLANIPEGHAHRFRYTFAVELLLAGVPIERVSVLLGHQSVRITEKHYSPWVRSRQEQLEADLARAWSRDPLVLWRGEVPKAAMHWSIRQIADETGVSKSTVHRIWQAFGLQPHRQKHFKLSSDPFFAEKVRDIVGLYLNPPENAVVLCVDEKSGIQALERTQPMLPLGLGDVEGVTHD